MNRKLNSIRVFWLLLAAIMIVGSVNSVFGSCLDELLNIPDADRDAIMADIQSDWAAREAAHTVSGFKVVRFAGTTTKAETVYDGFKYKVISHRIDGNNDGILDDLHYALIRYPKDYVMGGGPYPVLLLNHGGAGGVSLDYLLDFDASLPDDYVARNFFIVAPSFRAEKLKTQGLFNSIGFPDKVFVSGGTQSVLNYDVDDVMVLLKAVLANVPDTDPTRVAAYGTSRGGGVTLLLDARSPKIKRAVDFFGPSDMFLYSDLMIDYGCNGIPITNPARHVITPAVDTFLAGDVYNARRMLLQSSPAYYPEGIRRLQMHHGMLDDAVNFEHTNAMANAIDLYVAGGGMPAPLYEKWLYESGIHSVGSLIGQGERVREFLGSF